MQPNDHVMRADAHLWPTAACLAALPLIGSANEEVFQDSLKSAVFVGSVLVSLFIKSLTLREGHRLSAPIFLAGLLILCASSFASAFGPNANLAVGEGIRWSAILVFSWLVWDLSERGRWDSVCNAIWAGASLTAILGGTQFLTGWSWIDQAAAPAATFANKNLAAEYVAFSLPFGFISLSSSLRQRIKQLIGISIGLAIVFILMSGSRASLLGALVVCGVSMYRSRALAGKTTLTWMPSLIVCAPFLFLPSWSDDQALRGLSAIDIASSRTAQTVNAGELEDGSLGIRLRLWEGTINLILENPVRGVGAGAWEVAIPAAMNPPALTEPDYYAHNEALQIIAEHGIPGIIIVLAFAAALFRNIQSVMSQRRGQAKDQVIPAILTSGMISATIIALAGFPLHAAGTTAIFSVLIGMSLRISSRTIFHIRLTPRLIRLSQSGCAAALVGGFALIYICMETESKFIRAAQIGHEIKTSSSPMDSQWDKSKQEMNLLTQEALSAYSDHRKTIAVIGSQFASWGDWDHAVATWEPLHASRPNLTGLRCLLIHGYLKAGNSAEAAKKFIEMKIQTACNETEK